MNFKLNRTEMFFDLADEQAVIIDTMQGYYYAVNRLGSVLLDEVLKGGTLESAETVLKELGGPADIGEQICAFFDRLKEYRIILEDDGKGEVHIPQTAVTDGFKLEITQFEDMADLLTADPVHDVDEDIGWPEKKDTL
ncbi:MAG TPA: hypothetical protein PK854_06465 [Oscillospiraceae bacterium]|nr:hypothetical protein [Oscillospiraceae bacterium]HPS34889.1 hypothetical protein [Oscillospiraceae bacterium]